jgi:Uma2 family endonuclease
VTTLTVPRRMTTEEMLALPKNGVERDLIRGVMREKPMTRRGRRHSRATVNLAHFLRAWLATMPEPRGEILAGEQGFCIRKNPDTTVGIDVAYIGPQTAARVPDDVFLIDELPILAAEILSPSDTQEDILDKVEEYLTAGIPLVWVLEPKYRTVTVYQPHQPPRMFNSTEELCGDPHLPGFRVRVADLF